MMTTQRGAAVLLALVIAVLLAVPEATAQKTQKVEKPKPVQASQSTIREVLVKYEGKATSLGTLTRVAGDYFVVEQEGVSSMHPFFSIHTLRVLKDEEAGTEVLEILLMAKD